MVQLSFALIALTALSAFPHVVLAESHLDYIEHDRRQAGGCNFPNPPPASNVDRSRDGPIIVSAGQPFNGQSHTDPWFCLT